MAETNGTPPTFATINGADFPPFNFPVLFSDGVTSLARGLGCVKFYLYRIDPSVQGKRTVNPSAYIQVVMPAAGFAATAVFFEHQLKEMIANKEISQEVVDQFRATFGVTTGEPGAP